MKYRDDFKVRFVKKPEFIIDRQNKTVKCYLTCDVLVPTGLSGNRFMENFRTFAKGYAKCDEKDKFNPEVGKKIALARAESKIYWKVRTQVNEALRDAEMFIKSGEKFVNKAYRVMGHNENYIDKFIYPVKKPTSQILSEKAKSQPRDEQGRFTACTNNSKSKVYENSHKSYQNTNCNRKPCRNNGGVIKITINRE